MSDSQSAISSTIGSDEMDNGEIVLSYGDSLLYEADVRLLEPRGWINDSIIAFVFE